MMNTNLVLNCEKYISNNKDGFTFRIEKGLIIEPQSGYVVSVTPLLNVKERLYDIIEYIVNNKKIVIDNVSYDLNIGGWYNTEDHKYYYDLSIVIDNIFIAKMIGNMTKQIAIFDLNKYEEIRL